MANKLTNLKIGEVSFCKKGMNQHARVALFKSADPVVTGFALHKATFDEALEGNMIAGAVSEAFYDSFDGLWQRNDAFREALTDELSAGGDGSVASADYVASVKALVDSAVAEARTAGASAADTDPIEGAIEKAVTEWVATQELKKEQTTMSKFTTKALLMAGIAKFDPAKSTVAELQEIQKAATDLNCEGDLPVALAKAAPAPDNAALIRKVAELEMPADVRKHYEGMDEAGKTAFLAKTADERQTIVTKANEGDPVVHVTKAGLEIRKSDGATLLALAKQADKDAETIAKLSGDLTTGSLDQRAAAYPNVAKATAVSMLKSADAVGVESTEGKDVLKALDTMNKASNGLFQTIGGDDGTVVTGDLKKAQTDFDTEVGKIAARDKISRSDAMTKARTEHADLFKAAYPDMAEVEA